MTESEDKNEEKDTVGFEIFKSQIKELTPVRLEADIVRTVFLLALVIGGGALIAWGVVSIIPSTDTVITGFALFFTSPWFHIPLIFITWLICAISFMREESLSLRLILLTLIFILYVFSYPLVTS